MGGASVGSPVGLPERGAAATSALPAGIDLETVDLEGEDLDYYALALVEEVN